MRLAIEVLGNLLPDHDTGVNADIISSRLSIRLNNYSRSVCEILYNICVVEERQTARSVMAVICPNRCKTQAGRVCEVGKSDASIQTAITMGNEASCPIRWEPCLHVEPRSLGCGDIESNTAYVCSNDLVCFGACWIVDRYAEVGTGGKKLRCVNNATIDSKLRCNGRAFRAEAVRCCSVGRIACGLRSCEDGRRAACE
jgi:hypothetical protein